MVRYIDAEKLKEKLKQINDNIFPLKFNGILRVIDDAPSADVEKVVYCKDCRNFIKYSSGNICEEYGGYVKENDFCSRCPNWREDGF